MKPLSLKWITDAAFYRISLDKPAREVMVQMAALSGPLPRCETSRRTAAEPSEAAYRMLIKKARFAAVTDVMGYVVFQSIFR